jgi:hypothetical protein
MIKSKEFFETSETSRPMTERHIQEEWTIQKSPQTEPRLSLYHYVNDSKKTRRRLNGFTLPAESKGHFQVTLKNILCLLAEKNMTVGVSGGTSQWV